MWLTYYLLKKYNHIYASKGIIKTAHIYKLDMKQRK